MTTDRNTIADILAAAGREIRSSCGAGRFIVRRHATGTVQVTVHLDNFNRRTAQYAEHAVYSRLTAAAIPCSVAVV